MADMGNDTIRKVTSERLVTTFAGSGKDGSADGQGIAASFNEPLGLAIDNEGCLFVADAWNHLIRKITSEGLVTTFAGSGEDRSADVCRNHLIRKIFREVHDDVC